MESNEKKVDNGIEKMRGEVMKEVTKERVKKVEKTKYSKKKIEIGFVTGEVMKEFPGEVFYYNFDVKRQTWLLKYIIGNEIHALIIPSTAIRYIDIVVTDEKVEI